MGKRVIVVLKTFFEEIMKPRGPNTAMLAQLAGDRIPADAKLLGWAVMPKNVGFAFVYESAEWSTLALPGGNSVNGIPVLDGTDQLHLREVTLENSAGGPAPLGSMPFSERTIDQNTFCERETADGTAEAQEAPNSQEREKSGSLQDDAA